MTSKVISFRNMYGVSGYVRIGEVMSDYMSLGHVR